MQGLLEQNDLERALHVQQELEGLIGEILIKLGVISEADRMAALSIQLDLPVAGPDDYPAEPLYADEISAAFLKSSKVVPLREQADGLALAMVNPLDDYAIRAMSILSGKTILPYLGMEQEIDAAIDNLYGDGRSSLDRIIADVAKERQGDTEEDVEKLKDLASEAPIVRLVNSLFERAYEEHASDIHLEPMETRLGVRFRIDGVLREVDSAPRHLAAAVVSRIKIMAHMNIAERRLAQDGRIRLRIRNRDIDLRVSTVPTLYGESVVLRLLEHNAVDLSFEALGFDNATLNRLLTSLRQRHGILLVTGPTGSGKTTTLYTSLKQLNSSERKIITVEDPVEYQLDGITQIQVHSEIGLGFSNILRSIVRHDPDVIMIGEMRDLETAEIAVQSALTGHLVLSTLHTNDAAGAITRMLDMGIQDYLLTSTVSGVLGQRLVRSLCERCREAYRPSAELIGRMDLERLGDGREPVLYRATGCDACGGIGYSGRIGIFEFLNVSEAIRDLVLKRVDAATLHQAAAAEGMVSMTEDGIRKALTGATSLEEVLRVTRQH